MKERLKIIADSVNRGESMADIGTDHGFLPIFLLNEGICERAIATDISEAAIAKTREYSTDALKRGNLSLRCGSGIEVLEKGEVDIVVIAGMGGVLIAQILGIDPAKTISFSRFILQPRKGTGKLRTWLAVNGFHTEDIRIMREGSHYCEIMTVIPPRSIDEFTGVTYMGQRMKSGGIECDFPPSFAENADPLMRDYIKLNLIKELRVLENLGLGADLPLERLEIARSRVQYMENLLNSWIEKNQREE